MAEVVVVGAGISGLTAAHLLRASGHDVAVFDQGELPGGRMRSERIGGYLMEHGASSVVGPAPAAEELIGALDLDTEKILRGTGARNRYLVRAGSARALPLEPFGFFMSDFFTLAGRLRLLMEPFMPARSGDETLSAFARRRLGQEMLDYVMDPLAAGLYAGNPQQLGMCAAFPQLKQLERRFGSILLGALRSRWRRDGRPAAYAPGRRRLFSFREGLGTLPNALAGRLAGRVFLGHRVESVQRAAGGRFRVRVRRGGDARWIGADSVVVALPAYAAATVLAALDRSLVEALAGIGHPPLAVVFLGYRAGAIAHPLDGLGVLMPAVEKRDVLGILFSSTLYSGRAPPEHVALTALVGGARQPQLARIEPRELAALADREVRQLLGARAAPTLVRVHRWNRSLPQPGVDHAARLASIAAIQSEHAGLFLTGNYFSGVSTAACVEQAFATARRVSDFLGASCPRRRLVARARACGCAHAILMAMYMP
ncbi:MAG: protoporphyrinogen oxidase [Betaproteobacteria bacterium RIFCSPLOWO2_12_FULL_65_14]|nr:MAG: protoporphyrinogen oxidase [Betaproteobacteria bacterium RIFCSPLOWO2_12_FULL_65_14]